MSCADFREIGLLTFRRNAGSAASIDITAGYTCKETQGAVLVLNSPASEERVLKRIPLRDYMRQHHREWCSFARDTLGLDVSSNDIVLVIGCVKTAADWKAVRADAQRSSLLTVSLSKRHASVMDDNARCARSAEETE